MKEYADVLGELLERHEKLEHLCVKKWGKHLTLYSNEGKEQHNHARLTWLGGQSWGLSLPNWIGRWERTPFMGTMKEIIETLVEDLGFHLEPWPEKNHRRT